MPPKPSKPGGGDIRSFFGQGSSQPRPSQVNGSSQKKPIVLDMSDDDQPVASASTKAMASSPAAVKPAAAKTTPTSAAKKPSAPSTKPVSPPKVSKEEPPKAPQPKPPPPAPKAPSTKRKSMVIASSDDEDEEEEEIKPPKKAPRLSKDSSSKKAKPKKEEDYEDDDEMAILDDDHSFVDDDEDEKPAKGKGKGKAPAKSKSGVTKQAKPSESKAPTSKGRGKKSLVQHGDEPVEEEKPKPKFNYAAKLARAGPAAPGSKEIPDGKPDCLAGLTFVFTGELTSLSRDEAADLAKRFGGRVTGQPSSVTSYVVVGEDAGPSKLATIKKHNLRTLDEDGFLDLIRTREPVLDAKTLKKKEAEEKDIIKAAKEMEKREKVLEKEGKEKAKATGSGPSTSSQLWTTRYAPQSLNEICGNKAQVERLQRWLHEWPASLKSGFKKPGKDGMGVYRAVLITGPPGIGKTTSAHLVAKLEGLTPIEVNASDARSKKLVTNSTNIANKSLDGWMHGVGSTTAAGVELTDRTVLIMDEVDGMSGSDRGGIGALNQLIKKTHIPIICIANERNIPKMKPLQGTTYSLPFRKPDAKAVRSRILTIAFKEKMKLPANVVDQLVTGVQSDIRQVLNMLSTWKLSHSTMDFDESKELAALNEKYSVMTPFGVIEKLFGPYTFSATSRETLNDKMEYYFHDYSFVPLFVQENYAKTIPARTKNMDGPNAQMKHLELLERASRSISDGDLVDSMMHGSQQHWSLMPLHAVTSTVVPAFQMYGQGGHWGSPNAFCFPSWLGQNSKTQSLKRQLNDVQVRMRLKVSGDKAEIRQTYIPMLFPRLVKPLIDEGSGAVDAVIQLMDEYLLSKEEWDTIVELGVDEKRNDDVLKQIATATKTSFTRKYNAGDHPIPFNKGQDIAVSLSKKKADVPDLEEAFDVDEEVEDDDEDKPSRKKAKDPTGIADDKLVKVAKGKAPAKGKAKKG